MATHPRTGFERVEPPRREPPEPPVEAAADEPTDEQLERVMLLLGFPVLPEALRPPYYRDSLLNLHRLLQRVANGDEQAARRLEVLKAAFARPSGSEGALPSPGSGVGEAGS